MKYFWLNLHLAYACRHSGVCCTSGWPIPVERDRAQTIQRDVDAGRARPLRTPWLIADSRAPAEVAGVLAAERNRCVFYAAEDRRSSLRLASDDRPDARSGQAADGRRLTADGRRQGGCSVYDSRPSSCAHFPYVCLIDQRGVHVTLSHYCPTVTSLLFDHHDPIAIVEGPPPIAGLEIPEGLDARDSLPPSAKASGGKPPFFAEAPEGGPWLMSFDDVSAWEREAVERLATSRRLVDPARALVLHEIARRAVPPPRSWPPAVRGAQENAGLDDAWEKFGSVIARYLAAKVHASWAMYLGNGPDAVMRGAELAQSVLQVEAARLTLSAGRGLDERVLKDAIRMSDLLLVHYADPHFFDGSSAGLT